MKQAIQQISEGKNLSLEEAKRVMNIMLSGEATQAQLGAFLCALRMKGETLDEIVGCATVLKEKAEHISPNVDKYLDLVGTGGDGTFTFNISTTSAFVAAGAGLPIAKHGNRAISSKSGAADFLETLGVNITMEPEKVQKSVEEVGMGFMFAQTFNKSMRFVGQARAEIGIRSIFNILGPLANPSGAKYLLIGVYDPSLCEIIAKTLQNMGARRALVVCGKDGMDEITTVTETVISELKDDKVTTYTITPEQFGLKRANVEDLTGGNAKENVEITKAILNGGEGPKQEIVLLNAGAALYCADMADSIEQGIEMAKESIVSGKAMKKLEQLVAFSNQ